MLKIILAVLLVAAPAHADRADDLAARVLELDDPPAPAVAAENAAAAIAAETPDAPAELLLAIAWGESRYLPRTVGALGEWRHDYAPHAPPFYCGVSGATAPTWADCTAMRSPGVAYAATAAQLGQWAAYCRPRERNAAARRVCALAGYRAGTIGPTDPATWRKARAVLARAARLAIPSMEVAVNRQESNLLTIGVRGAIVMDMTNTKADALIAEVRAAEAGCTRCGVPCHASESDDDGVGVCCAAYTVEWSDGGAVRCESYAEAVAAVEARYPDAEIGHDGDLSDGGTRTLCWPDEDAADNDCGRDGVASILRAVRS